MRWKIPSEKDWWLLTLEVIFAWLTKITEQAIQYNNFGALIFSFSNSFLEDTRKRTIFWHIESKLILGVSHDKSCSTISIIYTLLSLLRALFLPHFFSFLLPFPSIINWGWRSYLYRIAYIAVISECRISVWLGYACVKFTVCSSHQHRSLIF